MKIKIVFFKENISWDKKWIFIGDSFENLKSVERKIGGQRLTINNLLHACSRDELKNYLKWTEEQRVKFNDSFNWWMTDLAGRNNLTTNFFLYICIIKSLKKYLAQLQEKEILIVSDDTLLINSFIKNFPEYEIEKSPLLFFYNKKSTISFFYDFARSILISLIDTILSFFCAKITAGKKNYPEDDVYLIHQYVETNSLKNKKEIKSRYFPYLKEYLKKEKKDIYTLTWSGIFWLGKLKAFKMIRKEKCFLPEDWVNIIDYISCTRNFFKTASLYKNTLPYPGINTDDFLLHEERNYLKQISSNLRFWIYTPALKNWLKKCNSITCLDHYENMIFEHALIHAIKSLKIKSKIYGYHHTLSSFEFTPWHSLKSEWQSKYKPDFIISLGLISKKMLSEQGIPEDKIKEGPALRYQNVLKKKNQAEKEMKNILVPLSHIRDASYEVISKIQTLSSELKDFDYTFIIKPHPNLDISKILTSLKLQKLPKNILISYEDIDQLLNNCLFTIFMSTGGAYNAVINGNIVLNLRSDLNISDNYLDIFEKDFSFIKPHDLNSIKKVLVEFSEDKQKIGKYFNEFQRLRKYLISGMNEVNELKLSQFK